jgi:hypothetical protein
MSSAGLLILAPYPPRVYPISNGGVMMIDFALPFSVVCPKLLTAASNNINMICKSFMRLK